MEIIFAQLALFFAASIEFLFIFADATTDTEGWNTLDEVALIASFAMAPLLVLWRAIVNAKRQAIRILMHRPSFWTVIAAGPLCAIWDTLHTAQDAVPTLMLGVVIQSIATMRCHAEVTHAR